MVEKHSGYGEQEVMDDLEDLYPLAVHTLEIVHHQCKFLVHGTLLILNMGIVLTIELCV